jgi:hypothetical protein
LMLISTLWLANFVNCAGRREIKASLKYWDCVRRMAYLRVISPSAQG